MDNTLQDIKDKLNIADVISGYIQIKKAGANFRALCPFHNEKTPSLNISPQKQIWHCFGCGEGGDIFGFVMRYENVEFKDALKILAQKAGVSLPEYRPQNPAEQSEKELLSRINNFASRFYHEILIKDKRGAPALEYLKNRGLTDGTIKQWQIGYAPDDFHSLEQALAKKKVSAADLVKAGVSAKNERGQIYDRFRGRVTFPIFNYFGEVVGFSARILIDDGKSAPNRPSASGAGQAKYVNSPETLIYNKSKILFGLNFAKESIRKADEAVIVEGQMDCIAPHQADFKNVVATSGTALTEQQLMMLGRLTKNLKFCFDTDTAGRAASRRAGELALKHGFRIKVIELKNVKDPDELVRRSPNLWQKAVSEAVWFLDYYINLAESSFLPGSVEQKHYLSREVLPLLGFISDPLEQDHYILQMARRFGISEKVIRQEIRPAQVAVQTAIHPQSSGNLLLEKEVLGGMLLLTEFSERAKTEISPEDFEHNETKQLFMNVLTNVDSSRDALAKEAVFMVESQLDELGGNKPALLRELFKALALLKISGLKKRQNQLQTEIKMAEMAKNQAKIEELNRLFAQVSSEKMKFEAML
ncbi:MAG: DNA primase [Candidatus Doudnabacteria bacterium]|nr:DNA primase [Candidatus Doudnabacteria bacterium]